MTIKETYMKLKHDFITQEVDGIQYLVPTGESTFTGVIRSNSTSAAIVNCLRKDTTPEEIVDKMYEIYDAPRSVISRDVYKVIEVLRSIGSLDE